jgi:pimeloyl-ACP methyl ester carboxylesterase
MSDHCGTRGRSDEAPWNSLNRECSRAHGDLSRRMIWAAGPLVLLGLAACASSFRVEDLPPDLRSDQNLLELPLHIVEVDDDGEGDEVDMPEEINGWCPEAEDRDDKKDDEIVLREQFKCVIKEAIKKHGAWVDKKPWPCGAEESWMGEERNMPLCLVFYFNGGLNSKHQIMRTAAMTYRDIENERMYPIYMIWPTGGFESYREDVTRVWAGRLNEWPNESDDWNEPEDWTTVLTTPLRPASDLLRGFASTPAAWATSFSEFYGTGFGFGREAYMMKRDMNLHVSCVGAVPTENCKPFTITPDRNLYFSPQQSAFSSDAAPTADLPFQDGTAPTGKQLTSYIYHGATAPIRALSTGPMVGVSEAGWRNMVRRTRTSVRSATEFPDEFADEDEDDRGADQAEAESEDNGSDSVGIAPAPELAGGEPPVQCDRPRLEGQAEKLRRCYPRGTGGFARVFQWLESCMTGREIADGADRCPLILTSRDRETLRNARIVMIGHSMGTIVINELLQLFPDLPYESLVYMAGAASVRDTARAATPVLVNNRGCTKFYGLMLHPMNEARESTYRGLLPSGSLLTYVDEFLEVPKTVPDRTVGQWRNLRATRHIFFEDARRWMLFHVFDRAEGDNSKGYPNPTTHGAFNDKDVPFWRGSFWKPEQVEFAQPQADCKEFFTSRLDPAEIPEEATRTQEWQRVLHEVQVGKTFLIRGEDGIVARIVPVPARHEQNAAGVAH